MALLATGLLLAGSLVSSDWRAAVLGDPLGLPGLPVAGFAVGLTVGLLRPLLKKRRGHVLVGGFATSVFFATQFSLADLLSGGPEIPWAFLLPTTFLVGGTVRAALEAKCRGRSPPHP